MHLYGVMTVATSRHKPYTAGGPLDLAGISAVLPPCLSGLQFKGALRLPFKALKGAKPRHFMAFLVQNHGK